MNDQEAFDVMARFGKAFFSKQREQLEQVITSDAEWHFAFGPDAPDGRVRRGVDGFMQGSAENDEMFERLRFDDVVIRALGEDQLVMTYMANGRHRGGAEFALRGIELITAKEGRLHRKDVFWKQHVP